MIRDEAMPGEQYANDVCSLCHDILAGRESRSLADPRLERLASFLVELSAVPWLSATELPKKEFSALEYASCQWPRPKMIDWELEGRLNESLERRFGERLSDVRECINEVVSKQDIPHHTALRTCQKYGCSLLVDDWCPTNGNVLRAMFLLYRKGAIVVSNLVVGRGKRTLALCPFVWG